MSPSYRKPVVLRILVTTNALVSHFLPLVPIAQKMKERGHDVRVAATTELGDEIRKHGLDHLVLNEWSDQEFEDLNRQAQKVRREEEGKLFMSQFFMGLAARSAIPGLLTDLEKWRPDLVLRESTEFAGLIAAKKMGIHHARFEIVNGESEESIASNYATEMDALRTSVSLPAIGEGYLRDEPALSAHPKILDDTVRKCGQEPFRFRTSAPPNRPVKGRPEWLQGRNAPLVYMTFGTVTAGEGRAKHIFDASLKAVANLPITVLVTTGKDAPPDLIRNVPENVVVRDFVDQAWILNYVDLMVCHGGSGTVLGGLAAGVPMIVVPMFADQPDNARCLAAAGLSITVEDQDIGTLGSKILDVLNAPERKMAAVQAADEIAGLPTLEDALTELATVFTSKKN